MKYLKVGNYIEHLMVRFNIRSYEQMKELVVNHPYVINIVYRDKQKQKVNIYSFDKALKTFKYAATIPEIKNVKFQYLVVKNGRIKWLTYEIDEMHSVTPKIKTLF